MTALPNLRSQLRFRGAGPLVDLLKRKKSRTRGSGADEGVRPTFALWDRPSPFVVCRDGPPARETP
jgi:hypothetical protein